MAETTAKEPKAKRAKRRNYERELAALKLYCEVNVEVLKALREGAATDDDTLGKVSAFESVLVKLNAGNGK